METRFARKRFNSGWKMLLSIESLLYLRKHFCPEAIQLRRNGNNYYRTMRKLCLLIGCNRSKWERQFHFRKAHAFMKLDTLLPISFCHLLVENVSVNWVLQFYFPWEKLTFFKIDKVIPSLWMHCQIKD